MTRADHQGSHHFQRWLAAGSTGCRFASHLASETDPEKRRFAYYVGLEGLDPGHVDEVEGVIDGAAANNQVAILLFPRARTSDDLVKVLRALARHDRWTVAVSRWTNPAKHGNFVPLSLQWKTAGGDVTEAIGFAPFGTMPVTRRAPYVAIAVWGGGHANEHKESPTGEVGVIDVFPGEMTAEVHEKRWQASIVQTRLLCNDPYESPKQLRNSAFCLPPDVAAACVRRPRDP